MDRKLNNIVFWGLVLVGIAVFLLITGRPIPVPPASPTSTAVSTEMPKPSPTKTGQATATDQPLPSETPSPQATATDQPTVTAVSTTAPTPRPSRTPLPSPQATATTGPNTVQRWEGSYLVFEGFMSSYSRKASDAQIGYFLNEFPQAQKGIAYIAVPNCDAVGMEGFMYIGDLALPVAIFDCAGPGAHRWMINNSICCEVDYYTDAAYGLAHKWAAVYLENK